MPAKTNVDIPNFTTDPTIPCTPFLTAKQAGWPEGLRKTYTDFAPRIGFAYRPFSDDKTVIRGGFGIFDVTTLGSVFYSVAGVHTGFLAAYSQYSCPCFQFPEVGSGGSGNSGFGTQNYRTANQFDKKDPYSIQWNLTVERVLHGNTALRVSYIANRGRPAYLGPRLESGESFWRPKCRPRP